MRTAPDGRPVFRPAGAAGAGDERWQAGSGISNGADGPVYSVVQSGTNLFIGGAFTAVGTVLASNVARWNGTTWSALGTGLNGFVSALAIGNNSNLYAGGSFSQAGRVPARYVAHWNGTAWSALGTGLNAPMHALAKGANGLLYVGGEFTTTGDGSKVIVGFDIYDPNAPLATTAATKRHTRRSFPQPRPRHGHSAPVRWRAPPAPHRRAGPCGAPLPRPGRPRYGVGPARSARRDVLGALRPVHATPGGGVGVVNSIFFDSKKPAGQLVSGLF